MVKSPKAVPLRKSWRARPHFEEDVGVEQLFEVYWSHDPVTLMSYMSGDMLM